MFVYAHGGDHPLRAPCVRVFDAYVAGRIDITTTASVIQEFVHVYARRRDRGRAVYLARQLTAGLSILPTDPLDLELGLDLLERHSQLGAFDAVLAAAALNRQAEALVSADRAFGVVPGLRWVDPGAADLDFLLGV